jgi:hypothetical protein
VRLVCRLSARTAQTDGVGELVVAQGSENHRLLVNVFLHLAAFHQSALRSLIQSRYGQIATAAPQEESADQQSRNQQLRITEQQADQHRNQIARTAASARIAATRIVVFWPTVLSGVIYHAYRHILGIELVR